MQVLCLPPFPNPSGPALDLNKLIVQYFLHESLK